MRGKHRSIPLWDMNGHSGSRSPTLVVARRAQSLGCLIARKCAPNPADDGPIRCDGSTLVAGTGCRPRVGLPSSHSYFPNVGGSTPVIVYLPDTRKLLGLGTDSKEAAMLYIYTVPAMALASARTPTWPSRHRDVDSYRIPVAILRARFSTVRPATPGDLPRARMGRRFGWLFRAGTRRAGVPPVC